MLSRDGRIVLVYNGEVYNFRELRRELETAGHAFVSRCDTEVVLRAYEHWGAECVKRFCGMFAFAIWDTRRHRLLAAVDRFGKKPLYYAFTGERLVFASEMKSLLNFAWINREIDPLAIDRYLTLRYVPAPLSMFKGIRKLEPSTLLIWEGSKLKLKSYWSPRRGEDIPYNSTTLDQFQELFTDAVKLRMQSDVPLGLYLSGGVDSSAVAGAMHAIAQGQRISYTLSLDYEHD